MELKKKKSIVSLFFFLKKKIIIKMSFFKRGFIRPVHLVRSRPWPLVAALVSFGLTGGFVMWWRKFLISFPFYVIFLLLVLMFFWWRDVRFERSNGDRTLKVLKFFRVGMILFILSEVLFFFRFFWAFFKNCFATTLEIGNSWPPFSFSRLIIDPFSIPLLKTVLLLSSGVTVTRRHHYIIIKKSQRGRLMLFLTLFLGVSFLSLQLFEYSSCGLRINRSSYGSSFYVLTGFHGFHVIIGSILLLVSFFRLLFLFYRKRVHLVFELRAWYWHFVDVVWLFLYFFIYWFGYILSYSG